MSIRIGDSAACSLAMVTPESRVVETRRYLVNPTRWYEISAKCIAEKKFLILTICIGFSDNLEYMPTETQWRNIVEDSTVKLLSLGGNKYNCRIDLINEPEKYCTKEKQAWLINIAYDQIGGRLVMGAGCSELNQRERYQYISSHATFETLVVHLQGACDTKAKTIDNLNFAQNLAISYNRKLDCNEANYKDVATSSGFDHLKMLVAEAERYGCANFPIVFNNLDQSAFPIDTDKWKFLAFKVNGILRSNHWAHWKILMVSKAPVPNLPILIERDDDMKLVNLKIGSKGNQVKWLQEILAEEYGYENTGGYDGAFGTITDTQVKAYQTDMGITVDGIVGKATTFELIEKAGEHFTSNYWMNKLQIWMGFE